MTDRSLKGGFATTTEESIVGKAYNTLLAFGQQVSRKIIQFPSMSLTITKLAAEATVEHSIAVAAWVVTSAKIAMGSAGCGGSSGCAERVDFARDEDGVGINEVASCRVGRDLPFGNFVVVF